MADSLAPTSSGPVEKWSGESYGWHYRARRINGDGSFGKWLDQELPLQGVQINDVLSGSSVMSATIAPKYAWLQADDGDYALREYATVIYAEADGVVQFGGLFVSGSFGAGGEFKLEMAGFTFYAKGRPYRGRIELTEVDPLYVVRHLWEHIQSQERSNLGMYVGPTTTPERIGKAAGTNTDGTSQDATPLKLNPEDTTDIGGLIDELAKATPFDYREIVEWNSTKTEILHGLIFGYPRLGARRHDVRLVYGENIFTMPAIERDGGRFANMVMFRGAGEGSAMIKAEASEPDGRLLKIATVDDDSVTDPNHAMTRARRELGIRSQMTVVRSVKVVTTGNAKLGSVVPGDEVRLQAETDWVDVDLWCRVVSIGVTPADPEVLLFGLQRSDAA
jgi:hypothetical protein